MTSPLFWKDILGEWLHRHPGARLAIVGVGHPLRGDDAVGPEVAVRLRARLPLSNHILIVDAGPVPENATGVLRRFQPTQVLLIDAADLRRAPGAVRLLYPAQLRGLSASTHSLPLDVLANYLNVELGCEVVMLGVQPQTVGVGAPLSAPVKVAINQIVEILVNDLLQPAD